MKRYVIADLDSTLANIDHRLPLITGPDRKGHRPDPQWDEFFQKCVYDEPIEEVIQIVQEFYLVTYVVIVTGRSDEVRQETEAWLKDHKVPYDGLLMRPAGSRMADDKLKRELIEAAGIDPKEVLFALEDRQRVVDMWRSLGIRTLQVAPGDF